MKQAIILATVCLTSIAASCQQDSVLYNRQREAGIQLQKYYAGHNTAVALHFAGLGIIAGGVGFYVSGEKNGNKNYSTTGWILMGVGAGVNIVAFMINENAKERLERAGIILADGKVIYPIDKKRH